MEYVQDVSRNINQSHSHFSIETLGKIMIFCSKYECIQWSIYWGMRICLISLYLLSEVEYHHLPKISLYVFGAWSSLPTLKALCRKPLWLHVIRGSAMLLTIYSLYIFLKSRSGVSNKEKSADVADFLLCMWSSLAASHHAHFDSAAVSQKNALKAVSSLQWREKV